MTPEARQVQRGLVPQATGVVRLEDSSSKEVASKGADTTSQQSPCHVGMNVLPVLPDLPFLQEKPEVQLSYVKTLNSLMLAINF